MHEPLRSQLTKKQRRQLPSLARLLLRRLEEDFPAEPFQAAIEPVPYGGGVEDKLVVRLHSAHPHVPALWFILFQPDEITAHWGRPWHWHIVGDFAWRKKGIPVADAERQTMDKAIQFVRDVLGDRAVVCLDQGGRSGVYLLPQHENALRDCNKQSSEFYVWSGPCDRSQL